MKMGKPLFSQDIIDQDFGPGEDAEEYDFDDDDEYDEYDEEEEPEDAAPVGISPDDPSYRNGAVNEEPITLEELEAVDDTAEEKFFVKQWGRYVLLKGISMEELKHIRRKANTKQAKISGMRRDIMERELLIAGLVQPAVNQSTFVILQQKSAGAVAEIANRILDKSGMGDAAEKARERRFPRKQ